MTTNQQIFKTVGKLKVDGNELDTWPNLTKTYQTCYQTFEILDRAPPDPCDPWRWARAWWPGRKDLWSTELPCWEYIKIYQNCQTYHSLKHMLNTCYIFWIYCGKYMYIYIYTYHIYKTSNNSSMSRKSIQGARAWLEVLAESGAFEKAGIRKASLWRWSGRRNGMEWKNLQIKL